MTDRPKQHIPVGTYDNLLCGCSSFRAMADARDTCSKCMQRVGDLLDALRTVVRHYGGADFTGLDARTVRTIQLAFNMEPTP